MKKIIPIILLFIFSSQHFAQEYFPLQTGNKWHMPGTGEHCVFNPADSSMICFLTQYMDTVNIQVKGDTIMPNGKTYSVLNMDLEFGKYVRVDTSFIYFYDDSTLADVPVFDLKAELYSTDSLYFRNSAKKYSIYLGEIKEAETLFGQTSRFVKYWVEGDKEFNIAFSDKFGPVYYYDVNWVDTNVSRYTYNLAGCIIDGDTYGDITPIPAIPLAVNNNWTFYGTGSECHFDENGEGSCLLVELQETITLTVPKDTVMANAKTYFKITAESENTSYSFPFNEKLENSVFVRADENYLYIYDDSADAEVALLNLTGTLFQDDTVYFGSEPNIGYNIWISGLEESVKFGQAIKTISYYLFELDTLEFVGSDVYQIGVSDKFGFTDFSQTYWTIDNGGDTANQFIYNRFSLNYELTGCTIDGVVYNGIGIESDDEPNKPSSFSLSQNYPNPFNPNTTIEFSIPKQSHIKLAVFDVLGREIAILASGVYSAGNYKASFNGANLPSGVYFYSLETAGFLQTKKFILLK